MQYQIEDLGLGSCWVQMRGRGLSDGTSAETVIQGVLNIPENLSCLCVLAVGHKADERKPQNEDRYDRYQVPVILLGADAAWRWRYNRVVGVVHAEIGGCP